MIRKEEIKIINPIAKLELESVLKTVTRPHKKKKHNHKSFLGEKVNVTSLKLRTFKHKGTKCICCGLKAQYFTLDKNKSSEQKFHLGLYAEVSGKEIMFTRDHITPKSEGGEDIIENMQTMCSSCNGAKGNFSWGSNILLRDVSNNKKKVIAKKIGCSTQISLSMQVSSKGIGLYKMGTVAEMIDMPIDEFMQKSKIDRISREISFNKNNFSEGIISILDMERTMEFKKLRVIQGVV